MTGKGFRFGLLLQVAIGPVSLFIFQLSNQGGFLPALAGVLSVTLVDAAFILAAILGMAAFLENQRVKRVFLGFGGLIIAVFGINTITEVFGWGFLPSLPIARGSLYYGSFVQGLIITAANPMTILFWAGVFATKVAEEAWSRADIYRFGLGAVISTIVCQTLIAAIGSFSHQFLARTIIDALNVIVGAMLIYFAVRLIKKEAA
jgi:threonine/homoserine/homoserine lactone efflux protein